MNDSLDLQEYVRSVLKERKETYLGAPTLIVQDFQNERKTNSDYDGRQLLELLQNANDAARHGTVGRRRILLRFTENILEIANTGEKFTVKGIRSILYSDLSSKPFDRTQIGSKGLGFRALLNWAEHLEIHSGELRVAFSEAIAHDFLTELRLSAKVQEVLQDFYSYNSRAENPIAILRCPLLLSPKCKNLDSEWNEFDTRIQLVVKPEHNAAVHAQLQDELTAEVLMFLPYIDELRVEVDGDVRVWQRAVLSAGLGQEVKVSCTDGSGTLLSENTWQVIVDRGNLPIECITTDNRNENGREDEPEPYEIKVAWGNDKVDNAPGRLFSYFRTGIGLPLPVRAHGTFDLTANRENLQPTETNRWLLRRLAQLLITAAQNLAVSAPQDPYAPLRLLWGRAATRWDFGSELDQLGFGEAIRSALPEARIFPVISGEYRCASEIIHYNVPLASYLSPEDEGEQLLCWPGHANIKSGEKDLEALRHTLQYLNPLPPYPLSRLLSRVAAQRPTQEDADYSEYAHLLFLTITELRRTPEKSPIVLASADGFLKLFSDESGAGISADQDIFLPPDGNVVTRLSGLAVVNLTLAQALRTRFNTNTNQGLSTHLEILGIKPYSFPQVISQALKRYGGDPAHLHPILFELFQTEYSSRGSSLPVAPPPVPLLTRHKKTKVVLAGALYFGREYDGPEALCALLYSYDQHKLVAAPGSLGLGKHDPKLVRVYLAWCGVANAPRWVQQYDAELTYKDYVLRRFNYKQSIEKHTFRNFSALKAKFPGFSDCRVSTIDGLQSILIQNSPRNILRWVKEDKTLAGYLDRDQEPPTSILHVGQFNYNRYLPPVQMASYVRWQIANASWLPVIGSEDRYAPMRALLPTRGQLMDDFSPLLFTPDLDKLAPAKKGKSVVVGGTRQITDILPRLGVNQALSELPAELLYEVLLELPRLDPEGKRVKRLYNEIASNYEHGGLDLDDPQRQRFLQEGKVWCNTPDGERYIALHENTARYISELSYGADWVRKFVTLAVEPRRGTKKIEQIFGVPPLRELTFSVVGTPPEHPQARAFAADWDQLLPYIYALLPRNRTIEGKRKELKSLRLQLTTSLLLVPEASENDPLPSQETVPLYGHFNLPASSERTAQAWLVAPEAMDLQALKRTVGFADAIAELLANLLDASELRDSFYNYATLSGTQRTEKLQRDLGKLASETLLRAQLELDLQVEEKQGFWVHLAPFIQPTLQGALPVSDSGWHAWLDSHLDPGPLLDLLHTLYDELPAPGSWQLKELEQVFEVFKLLKLEPAKFNASNPQPIAFQPLFQQEFNRLIFHYETRFELLLYEHLLVATPLNQKRFQALRDGFTSLQAPDSNLLALDAELAFFTLVKQRFAVSMSAEPADPTFSLSKQYAVNEQALLAAAQTLSLPDTYITQTFLKRPEWRSWVYFGQIEPLLTELKRASNQVYGAKGAGKGTTPLHSFKVGDKTLLYSTFSDLTPLLYQNWTKLDLKIRNLSTQRLSPLAQNSAGSKSPHRFGAGNGLGKSERDTAVGAIGEWLVFQALQEKYGSGKVKWVSENAVLFGFEQGRAGEGYDLSYEDKHGRIRYVEVKSSTEAHQRQFFISSAEVRFAEAHRSIYDIILVGGLQSPNGPTLECIRKPFEYSRNESFMDNHRFSVKQDSFLVLFNEEIAKKAGS